MKRIFFVEDDWSLITGLSFAVQKQGYEVAIAQTRTEAEDLWQNGIYDLVILDVSLPDGSGFELCKMIRQTSKVPIIFLTAADEETDVIMGLDIGGDDYITKPFKLAVFLSRVNALLRRSENFNQADTELHSNDITIHLLKGEVYKNGFLLDLTAGEYKLLCLFMENPNIVLSPKQILGRLWDCNENFINNNTLTVYIRRLRAKIEDDPASPKNIVTVRRMGYKWNTMERGYIVRILTNRSIKVLFFRVLLGFAVFTCLTVASVDLQFKNASWCVLLLSVCLGFYVVAVIYMYFCRQGKIMETAIGQIAEFIAGDSNARIECDDEGDLYRLFHEVNSLVSMLNAHAENESRSKNFLKEIISDISHQLKTPLAALNIYNGILQEAGKELSTIAEFTSLSEKELERIEVLVQNLLKMAKLDAGAIVMEKSLCNISEMMDDVQRQFSYRAEQEGKTFLLSGNDDIALFCDQNWMMEAVGNVVKNAFDHTKKGDIICITWRKFATVVQMTVSDNGSGIHPEDYPHIFKRFYRSRFSQSTQGVGLGLPLAKTIIEAHSGTIEVDGTQEHGAIFTMNFLNPTKL